MTTFNLPQLLARAEPLSQDGGLLTIWPASQLDGTSYIDRVQLPVAQARFSRTPAIGGLTPGQSTPGGR